MRTIYQSPRLVPAPSAPTYIVLDDFGKLGLAYRETDPRVADLETLIDDLISGQYNKPRSVVAFETESNWSEDVTADVAHEIRLKSEIEGINLSDQMQSFIDEFDERHPTLPLRGVR
jgi:hypothetical protein